MSSGIRHQDAQYLRDYLTAGDATRYDLLPEGVVCLNVTHSNLKAYIADIRIDLHTTIENVKHKLYTHIGTKPHYQRLSLYDGDRYLYPLDDNSKMLGYYSVENGMRIHIHDSDPHSMSKDGGLEDVSKIQKYRMSEEDYDKRKGTLREWIKNEKAKDPNWKMKPMNQKGDEATPTVQEEYDTSIESVSHIKMGERCECQPGARRGIVSFVGEVEGLKEGYWVGVTFDEPLGKSNGTIKGKEYFKCPENFGGFLRGKNVTCGDFPEIDEFGDDDDEDEI